MLDYQKLNRLNVLWSCATKTIGPIKKTVTFKFEKLLENAVRDKKAEWNH